MRRNVTSGLVVVGVSVFAGCGSVPDVIIEAVEASAKEAIEEAIEQAVDEAVDSVVDQLPDLGGLTGDDEPSDE